MVMVFLSEFTGLEFGKKVFWVISGNKKNALIKVEL